VVVAAPVASRLDRSASGDDRSGAHELGKHLTVDAAWAGGLVARGVGAGKDPLMQAEPAVAEAVLSRLVRTCDEAVEGH